MKSRRFSALMLAFAVLACNPDSAPVALPPSTPPAPTAAQVAWLKQAAVPFSTDDPEAPSQELEPLRTIIGNARVVSLGEATHGTRDFFRMKDRILRFLVREMGFTAFAIEATWPEANRLDAYVRTGAGSPETLLSGLYFWTWNTDEVLQMVKWMRTYNAAGGSLGFYGFDMQFPGMAIFNVNQYLQTIDPAGAPDFASHLLCLAQFANDPAGRLSSVAYSTNTQAYRDQCRTNLLWVVATLEERRATYVANSSATQFAQALQSARVAVQYEELASSRRSRDAAMADNALWLLDQLGPNGKIVLWAHNGHVNTREGAMGNYLRAKLGTDMVVLGFDFGSGPFIAVAQVGTTFYGTQQMAVLDPTPAGSYESYFRAAAMPRFLLDLRGRNLASDSAAWLAGPRDFRSIGAGYDPSRAGVYYYAARLPNEFDVMIYFDKSSPSTLLPLRPPTSF